MEMLWSAVVERFTYDTIEEKQEHRKMMLEKGYVDTGLSVCGIPGENGVYRRVLTGEYKKYSYRK